MSIRLGEFIVYGELYNTSHYCAHGFLILRGENGEDGPMRVHFEVTGDCDADLKGKHIRFQPAEDDGTQIEMPVATYRAINPTQHGVTGTMTAQGWVRALPCTVEEFVNRSALGEPPPTTWRNRLMLEWFGPSGRVTVEMAGPVVEYCTREPNYDDEDDEGEWAPLENLAFPPYLDGPRPGTGPAITRFDREDEELRVQEVQPFETAADSPSDPEDFQQILDAETSRIDREIAGVSEEEVEKLQNEMERMDYCLENGEKQPIETFIGCWSELPKPDTLDDVAVEGALKNLLARLVLCGVVLDVCEHFSPRDCYRLLLEEILPEDGVYKELVGTGWIQHHSTWEYCKKCEEELDEKFKSGEL